MKIRIEIRVAGSEIYVLMEKDGCWADEMEFHIEEEAEMERAVLHFIRKSIAEYCRKTEYCRKGAF